jgi:hypothetical protein
MVYFAGYGLQFEGENYLVPVDAKIPTAADAPIQAVPVSDLTRALAQLPMKARIVVLDAARENPFARAEGHFRFRAPKGERRHQGRCRPVGCRPHRREFRILRAHRRGADPDA